MLSGNELFRTHGLTYKELETLRCVFGSEATYAQLLKSISIRSGH